MKSKPYRTVSGFTVVPVHYSMHPERDDKWVEQAKKGYDPDSWAREMEIDFTKTEFKRVYKFFDEDKHCRNLEYIPELPLLRGWDFGYRANACVISQWDPTKDQLHVLGEVICIDSYIHQQKQKVVEYCSQRFPEHDPNMWQDFCDHAGTFKSERAEKTSVEVLNDGRIALTEIYPISKKADVTRGLTIINNLLSIRKDGEPGILIDKRYCPILIRGFKGEYILNKKNEPAMDQHPIEDPQDALRYTAENHVPVTGYKEKDEDGTSEDELASGWKTSTAGYVR